MTQVEANNALHRLNLCIKDAQNEFSLILRSYLEEGGETSEVQYIRYLSFQYHLTKDVQRYFFQIAAHPDLARRRKLRSFLISFGNEEELHYLVAANDLHRLNATPLAMPFDVELWHIYFQSVIKDRPFVRLGAACILENISDGSAKSWVKRALQGSFLTRENTKFLVLHQHETLPHGDQLLEAVASADLDASHLSDLLEGAKKGTILYLRMAEWAIKPHCLAAKTDRSYHQLSTAEAQRISHFDMSELETAGS